MTAGFRVRSPRVRLALAALALALLGTAAMSARFGPTALAPAVTLCENSLMSDAAMAALGRSHFEASPAHAALGYGPGSALAIPVDTFIVRNYQFDADHHVNTQNDVVTIHAGESVLFKWEAGFHTTTSGNPGDLDSGSLWDYPVDSTNPQTVVSFPNPGTFPFQCLFHGQDFGMTGTVIVLNGTTPARASTWGTVKARYR